MGQNRYQIYIVKMEKELTGGGKEDGGNVGSFSIGNTWLIQSLFVMGNDSLPSSGKCIFQSYPHRAHSSIIISVGLQGII